MLQMGSATLGESLHRSQKIVYYLNSFLIGDLLVFVMPATISSPIICRLLCYIQSLRHAHKNLGHSSPVNTVPAQCLTSWWSLPREFALSSS